MAIRKFNSIGGFSVGEIGNTHDVINNVGNVTANNLTVTNKTDLGNVGNVTITGGTSGFVLKTDGSGNLTWVDPLASGLSGSNTQIQFNDSGSLGASANLTFDKATNTLTTINVVSSNVTASTLTSGRVVLAGTNGKLVDDSGLTYGSGNLTVSTKVSASLLTGTLTTASQPNITSVGTLTGLTVEGDTSITGNLKVQGSFDYINSTTTYISDPITEQGGGANGAALSSNDSRDRGALLHYYTTEAVDAFMGWDNSNAEFAFGSNVSVTDNIVTFNTLGNVRAKEVLANLQGSFANVTGNIVSGNLTTNTNVDFSATHSVDLGNVANITIAGGANGQILQTDGAGNVTWIDNTPTTVVHTANSIALTNGVYVSGDVTSIQVFGDYNTGNVFVLTDGTGSAPAWYVDIDFVSVDNFNRVVLNINYTQASGHTIYVQLYNNVSSAWDNIGTYTGLGSYYAFALQVIDGIPYINGSNKVQLRLYHSNGGNASHTTSIDYAALELSNQGPQGPKGSTGATGPTGPGVPSGGTVGQVIVKNSSTNYDTSWTSSLTGLVNISATGNLNVGANAHVSGDLSVDGNLTFTGNGTINQISGNAGQFFGDAHGVGALYAGIPTGYATVYNPIIQASADDNNYVQINFQNINDGTEASTDYCATAGNGDDTKFFIDMGITSGTWDGTQQNSVGNAALPDDGYLYVQGDSGAGNLVLGTVTSGTNIKFLVGGPNTGNVVATMSSGEFNLTGNVVATHLKGEAGNISNVQGANVSGEVSSANIAWRVSSSSQPNITSVGTLTSLAVSGDTTITGNLIVNGSAEYANITSFIVKDPIIEQGGNTTGALTANDGKDRGQLLHYYTSEVVDAFMGWDNSNAEFAFGSNVTVDSEVVTFNELATVRAGHYISSGATIEGTATITTVEAITGSFTDSISTANAAIANASISSANITDLKTANANVTGTLTVGGNLVVNGTTTFVNSTTVNYVDPIIQLNGNPDGSPLTYNSGQDIGIRVEAFDTTANSGFFGRKNSSGYFEYLTNISEISGVVTGDFGTYKGLSYISTATTGTAPFVVNSTTRVANLNVATAGVAETVSNAAQPNITSVGTLTSANVSGNIKTGNANLGNLATANFFSGNGSLLTSIVGANVTGQVPNATVSGTVYSSSQPNITSVGTLTSLTVNGTTDLGPLRDVHISGGATGYYLTTNGAGDLTWAPSTSTGDAKFVSMIKRDFVADGSTFVYTLPTTPATQEAVSVNIDGLLQTQSVYTVLGAEVHFATAPIAGQIIEFTVYGVVDITGNDGEIYFSNSGQIGADSNLTYNSTTGQLTANGFTGNGYHLHHINSANIVGGINSALSAIYSDTAGSAETVTDPNQPNITSVGTLTGLSIAGHIIPAADITYDLGNTTRRFRDLHLSGQTIQLGDSTLQTVGDTLVLTNPIGGQFIVDGSNAAYATLASYVTEANQSNITQLGNLVTLDVTGDLANGYAGDIHAAGNITANGNIVINGSSLTIGTSMIAVDSGNAGIFNLGVSNVSIGRQANVILSTSGKTTDVKGMLHVTGDVTTDSDITTNTLNAGYVSTSDGQFTGTLTANKIKVGDLYSSRSPIEITTDTPIDSFDPLTYRSAKYTIRVNSGDGYQAAEVLLIHDGADAYVTIYGSLSTIGLDIASFRAEITAGIVTLYATTNSGTTTTVNLLGTYVAD